MVSRAAASSKRHTVTTKTADEAEDWKFKYDAMYEEQMRIEKLVEKEYQHGSLLRYLLCELLATRSETLMDVVLPSYLLECRSFLEMYSDFIRPTLFRDIASGGNAEERMLRVLRFYLGGLSKMRGLTGMARRPLQSVKGECFRCNWKTSKLKAPVSPPEPLGDVEDYMLESGHLGDLVTTPSQKIASGFTRTTALASGHGGGKYTPAGLIATHDPDVVRFIAEQVSTSPPVSTFYVECPAKSIRMKGTIKTRAKMRCGCVWNIIKEVKVVSEGIISIKLDDFKEEYKMTLPTNRAKGVLSKPRIDFHGFVKVECSESGYQSIIWFPKSKTETDRFRVGAYVIPPGSNSPLYVVRGKWNGVMTLEKGHGEPITLFSAREAPVERKLMYPVRQQSFYESRRLWRRVVKAMVEHDLERAEKLYKDTQRDFKDMPQNLKYFKKKKGNKRSLTYELINWKERQEARRDPYALKKKLEDM